MPKNPEETASYSPIFHQTPEERKIDLRLIQKGEQLLAEYREQLREAQAYLADPTLPPQSRENIMKLSEKIASKLDEEGARLNDHKIRLGLEVNQPIRIQP